MADLSTEFTGIRFPNPFLLASAPPTESESNILRAYEAGWGGVVTKTIGLHQVVNVRGPRTTFLRSDDGSGRVSMTKRPASTVIASWNWELISDKPLDWWVGRLSSIKRAFPDRVLVASIMAGSGSDAEMRNWQTLVQAVQDDGVDAVELNFSCPHMDRVDMGSNVGKDKVLCSTTTQAVKEVARIPVWVKLTPATADIVEEAEATFLGGADAVVSTNTFPSLPPIDPQTLEFEVNVDGLVSSGGLGGPAILAQSLAKMAQLTQAFPERALSGVGGISTWPDALSYFLLGCGTVQVATAAMLDHAIGPNIIRELTEGMSAFLDRHADRGWHTLDDFRGLRRDAVVPHANIPRPGSTAHAPHGPGTSHDAGARRFDEKAEEWDTPERIERTREAARIVREHIDLSPSMRVIDIGAGTGLLGLELASDVASVLLAEPSQGMLEVTHRKLAETKPTNVTAVAYDLEGDPPPGGPFDLAVSLLVLHHVADTAAALGAIHALLAPGGRIALLDLDAEDGSFHEADAEGIHHHGFDQARLRHLAAAAGFRDVASSNVSHVDRDGRDYPVFLLTGRRA